MTAASEGSVVAHAALAACAGRLRLLARPVQVRHGRVFMRWAWPGVVSILSRDDGSVIARSLPGRPTVEDRATGGRDRPAVDRQFRLQAAASILEGLDRMPRCRMRLDLPGLGRLGPNDVEVLAAWTWPGIVRVCELGSGELLAESEPGRPDVPRSSRRRSTE